MLHSQFVFLREVPIGGMLPNSKRLSFSQQNQPLRNFPQPFPPDFSIVKMREGTIELCAKKGRNFSN